MICDSCIHKEVCYEKEEDRQALKHCSDYFNYAEELEIIKAEINNKSFACSLTDNFENDIVIDVIKTSDMEKILDRHIEELKGE